MSPMIRHEEEGDYLCICGEMASSHNVMACLFDVSNKRVVDALEEAIEGGTDAALT